MWEAAGPASCGVRRTQRNCSAVPDSAMSEAELRATEDLFLEEAIQRLLPLGKLCATGCHNFPN